MPVELGDVGVGDAVLVGVVPHGLRIDRPATVSASIV
jgi:hypothetical protein